MGKTLAEQGKNHSRKGTLLVPRVLVWLVVMLTIRRDLNYDQALNWMLSGFRWLSKWLPAQHKLVSDSAISHARLALGVEAFWVVFIKLCRKLWSITPDFHGRISVAFDSSTDSMPDTEANRKS